MNTLLVAIIFYLLGIVTAALTYHAFEKRVYTKFEEVPRADRI